MYRFIETVRVENGFPCLLPYHEERMNRTRARFFPGVPWLRLSDYWTKESGNGVMKWRSGYVRDGVEAWFFTPFTAGAVVCV